MEALVAKKHGAGYLSDQREKTKLRAVNREMTALNKRLRELECENVELEAALGKPRQATEGNHDYRKQVTELPFHRLPL